MNMRQPVVSLHQVQDEFQRFLLRGDGAIENRVVGTSRVPVATRLEIYGGGYGARLTEALQANFPMLARLLGEADFERMAAGYIRAHDSTFSSIRYYGNQLAQFLEQEATYASVPVLAEMARWEWAMTEVFDSADAVPVEPSAMAQVAPEQWAQLRLEWHPSVRRLALAWDVPQVWKTLASQEDSPADTEHDRPEVTLAEGDGQWLLWRSELDIFFRSLTAAEVAALDMARDGGTFGEVCDVLCGHTDEAAAPAQAAGFLREWLQAGLITKVVAG
jgi:putative DNA-binding protein